MNFHPNLGAGHHHSIVPGEPRCFGRRKTPIRLTPSVSTVCCRSPPPLTIAMAARSLQGHYLQLVRPGGSPPERLEAHCPDQSARARALLSMRVSGTPAQGLQLLLHLGGSNREAFAYRDGLSEPAWGERRPHHVQHRHEGQRNRRVQRLAGPGERGRSCADALPRHAGPSKPGSFRMRSSLRLPALTLAFLLDLGGALSFSLTRQRLKRLAGRPARRALRARSSGNRPRRRGAAEVFRSEERITVAGLFGPVGALSGYRRALSLGFSPPRPSHFQSRAFSLRRPTGCLLGLLLGESSRRPPRRRAPANRR